MGDNDFDKKDLLILEYKQTGDAYRHQANLLNKAYYLSAIVFTFLAGALANLLTQGEFMMGAILSLIGVPAFIFLGAGASAYHRRRETASTYRQTLTDEINSNFNDNVLRLQGNIAAGSDAVSKKKTEYPLNNLYLLLFGIAGIFAGMSLLLFGVAIGVQLGA